MKKQSFLLMLSCLISVSLWATSAGNLRIVQTGTTSAEPKGGWYMGLGERGKTLTMTAATLSTLLDSNNHDLTLCFDTIFISGNVIIDRSSIAKNQSLTLQTNDFQTGAIVFLNGATLTLKAGANQKSFVTLTSGNINGSAQVTATKVTLSNVTKSYERIEMNGFNKWQQWQIDTLLAHADKVGPDIGNGAYDFTSNTRFTIDSNHVFSMKALTSFTGGKKMGFKNMDRGGTLLPDDYSLGAYPDSFYVDLSQAEGIRFKVNLQGSATSFNIGLSNCLKKGQWHEYCFEYYVYNIPFTAVDKEGYVTLPFSLFEKVSWSGTWDLSKLIVFIMEVSNATTNTVVSFSDVHGYRSSTETQKRITVGNIKAIGELEMSASMGEIRQRADSRIEATTTSIICDKNVILENADNHFGTTVNLNTPYAYLRMRPASTSSTKYNFNANSLLRYDLKNVWVDNASQGIKYNYTLTTKDTLPHSYEVTYNSSYFTLATDHDRSFCEQEPARLVVTGGGKPSQYHWFDEQMQSLDYTDTLLVPETRPGKYRYYVELDTQIMGRGYHVTQSANVEIHPAYSLYDTVTICESALPYKWQDTLFAAGTTSGQFVFERYSRQGCDSITYLQLTVLPTYSLPFADSICAGENYESHGFNLTTLTADGGKTLYDTLRLSTLSGCDSTVFLQLYLMPLSQTEISDTVKKGETYTGYGFEISGTALGTADFTDTLTNANGCDSLVILHLTTIINDGIARCKDASLCKAYPNPVHDRIRVEMAEGSDASELMLTDLSGRVLARTNLHTTATRCELETGHLAAGFYYLSLYNSRHQLLGVIKICKE